MAHWNLNGSQTDKTFNGLLYRFTWDDEDRLTKMVTPGTTDTYTYNGLGLRVGKTDSTGTCSYICDGITPGSPVLADGHTLYTPDLSENRGGTSVFYDFDRIGNLWTLDGTTKNPPGKREVTRRLEQQAQRVAKGAAKVEREVLLETEEREALAEAATASEELAFAEAAVAVDEAIIVVGVIIK